ncbi:hypothetical protein GCM10018783_02410 [Streptomyces griseosporeus]|nr:hypothetical protein GCM10018783_02410 [Streptomyces griseosporeus]
MSAVVRRRAPDGTAHLGRTLVDSGTKAGTRVEVWLDAAGRGAAEPPTRTEAALAAALFATGAGLGLAGLASGAGAPARGRLDRRRIAASGREWDSMEPRWSRRAKQACRLRQGRHKVWPHGELRSSRTALPTTGAVASRVVSSRTAGLPGCRAA